MFILDMVSNVVNEVLDRIAYAVVPLEGMYFDLEDEV